VLLLDGKVVAATLKNQLKKDIEKLQSEYQKKPGLAVVMVGDDPASAVYVGHKIKTCQELGIESFHHHLPKDTSEKKLLDLIEELNVDKKVHGILVQMPVPDHISYDKVLDAISPTKDVDGLTATNIGLAWSGRGRIYPCTPAGIIEILNYYKISIERKNVVVVGRSDIVGKPMAQMFLERNATVTICHSKTKGLEDFTKDADIVVVAVGKRNYFTKDFFTSDSVVIDVGMHRLEKGLLCGDVFFKDVDGLVRAITPVPGGVGPMTIVMLMKNTLKLYELQMQEKK
jgi:methylenetetrahydrofolate dehydrogenase (NADP+)/methenyltetrahydrofolate cyclohydrolase